MYNYARGYVIYYYYGQPLQYVPVSMIFTGISSTTKLYYSSLLLLHTHTHICTLILTYKIYDTRRVDIQEVVLHAKTQSASTEPV